MSNTLDEIERMFDGHTYEVEIDGKTMTVVALYSAVNITKNKIQALITEARNNSLLDLENWAILHDLDAEMILDGIEHMVISNLQVPDQPRRDNSERLTQLKKGLSR